MPQASVPLEKLRKWAEHPVTFSETVIGDELWSTQVDILDSLTKPRAHVAVKGCHGSSKTWTASRALIWWLLHDENARAVTTAPTWVQVVKQVWAEVNAANRLAHVKLFQQINQAEIKLSPTNYAIGISTNESDRFQGWHGKVLVIIDEAPGVFADLWTAIEGIEAGGDVRVLSLGNPTIASGPFFESFQPSQEERWKTFTISAFDTPNFEGVTLEQLLKMSPEELSHNPIEYMVSRQWVKERYKLWGPQHPMWFSRVLGQFPIQAEDALISLEWIQKAQYAAVKWVSIKQYPGNTSLGTFVGGLDVAGPGKNETVLTIRRNNDIVGMYAWADPDPRDKIKEELLKYRDGMELLNVDSSGIGYYLGLELRELGYPVQLVNVGEAAREKDRFANLKAELYWSLRQRFEQGQVAGLRWEQVQTQLAALRWHINSRQQITMETKEEMARRGVESPDWADSLMLAFTPWIRRNKVPGVLAQGTTRGW